MKRKNLIFSCICIVSMIGTGCASSSVTYIDETEDINTTATAQTTEAETIKLTWDDNNLDGAEWEEKLDVGDGSKIWIEAEISTSDEKDIYEYVIIEEISQEQKKKILEAIFDGEVYRWEDEYVIRDVWDNEIEYYKSLLSKDEGWNNSINEMIEFTKEKLDRAPEQLTPASDYSGFRYLGFINGLPHKVNFYMKDEYMQRIKKQLDAGDALDEILSRNTYDIMMDVSPEEDMPHILKEEDELNIKDDEMAEAFVYDIIAAFEMEDVRETYHERQNFLKNYYSYHFSQGPETADTFTAKPRIYIFTDENGNKVEQKIECGNGQIYSYVHNDWVTVSLYQPFSYIDKKSDITVLPFEDIVESVKNELSEHPERYLPEHATVVKYTDMKRTYVGIADEGIVRKIPCWRLSADESFDTVPVIVNAIDGSILSSGE